MYRQLLASILCGAVALMGLIKAYGAFKPLQPTLHECSSNGGLTLSGPAQLRCWNDDKQSVIRFTADITNANELKFENIRGKTLDFVFQSDGNATLQILEPSGKEVWIGYMVPTIRESLAPSIVHIEVPAGINTLFIKKLNSGEANLFDFKLRDKEVKTLMTTVVHESRTHIPWISVGIAILGFFSILAVFRKVGLPWVVLLVFAYTLLFFLEGLPFYTTHGIFDPFDDKSYVEWAHHIGYQLKLQIADGTSAAAGSNIHSWGTGFVLAPAFFIARLLLPPGTGLEPTVFSLLTVWSAILGLITIGIYYAAFSEVFPRWIAATVSFLTIAGTCLTKWTFGRLIFSHTPEALSLAIGTFFFIKIYLKDRKSLLNYLGLAFALWLTIQIRRENILLAIVPAAFEILRGRSYRQNIRGLAFLAFIVLFAIVSLQFSNTFTRLGSFWAPVPTAGIIALDWARLKANFIPVLFSTGSGFFTVGVFVPLSSLALLFFARNLRFTAPFIIVIAGYLLMCMLHQYPTGFEWQNRFLLKLNPIIFAGLGIVLDRSKVGMRALFMLIMAAGLLHQHQLYLENLHPHQTVYADLFTDRALLQPFAFYVENRFLFPLTTILTLCLLNIIYSVFIPALIKVSFSRKRLNYKNNDLISLGGD